MKQTGVIGAPWISTRSHPAAYKRRRDSGAKRRETQPEAEEVGLEACKVPEDLEAEAAARRCQGAAAAPPSGHPEAELSYLEAKAFRCQGEGRSHPPHTYASPPTKSHTRTQSAKIQSHAYFHPSASTPKHHIHTHQSEARRRDMELLPVVPNGENDG
jgi:hypothetical protein